MYYLIKSWLKHKINKDALLYYYRGYKQQAYPGDFKDNLTRWFYLLFRGRVDLIYKAYFDTAFKFAKIDIEIIKRLNDTITYSSDGCLLDNIGELRTRTQVNFIASIIKQRNVKRILETGTHKAMFCYIAYLCNNLVSVDTFGNLPESVKAVEALNQKYGGYIQFHLGDSSQTLNDFAPNYQFDFAWVDGGHSFEICLNDLSNCARLEIPNIAVDDYKCRDDVKKAVTEFVKKYDYSIANITNLVDYRGIVHLVKDVK